MPLRHPRHCQRLDLQLHDRANHPVAIANIRWKTYMIFFVLNIWFAIIVWLVYPETSGRTLEEIDLLYTGDCDRLFVLMGGGCCCRGSQARWGGKTMRI